MLLRAHHPVTGTPDTPRIAIIQKSDGLLTWRLDLEAAFRDAGAITRTLHFRASSLAERWTQYTHHCRHLGNPSTVQRLARALADFSPDLVLLLNYPSMPSEAAELLRKALPPGVPIVGWLCDSVETFPTGHNALLDGVYYFDSASLPVLQQHYQDARTPLEFLPLAACPRRYPCPNINLLPRKPYLAFIGNCTPQRQRFFSEYRQLGQPLDLYGPHAGNFPQLWRNRKLSSARLNHLYRQYLINLNLRSPGNTVNGLNMRAFEIPCSGGFATYPDVPDLARCFVPNKEILVYQSAADISEMVNNMIRHPDQALAITQAGHRRVMREHTFYHRAVRILADWIGSSFQASVPNYIQSTT